MGIDIIRAIEDENLFRPFLQNKHGSIETWAASWMPSLKMLHGLKIPKKEWPKITEITGRTEPRDGGFSTALFLTGRRSGKSRIAAVAATFEAALAGHEKRLAKGEKGVVLCVAPSKSQARIVTDYIRAILQVPLLKQMVVNETKEGVELSNSIRIEIAAGDWRTVRGYTLVAAIVDEAAFLGHDAESKVKSDTELIRAIQPSLATTGGKLIAISSPYAKRGWCYRQFQKHFGNNNGDTLVLNAPSRVMNPTLPQSVVDQAMAEDAAAARAEYLGEFRDDIAAFLPREVIEQVVVKGRNQIPFQSGTTYVAFVDVSGGRSDDAALAIAHLDGNGKVVVDYLRRWRPPFNPDSIIGEMVVDLGRYRISEVVGDNYSAEFTKQAFESRGVMYARATSSDFSQNPIGPPVTKPKSQLYAELLPRICSGEIELLDHDTLISQLANLERRTRSGGRDIIDHPPGQHDDLANVVAGVADVAVHAPKTFGELSGGFYDSDDSRGANAANAWSERVAAYEREMAEERRQIERAYRGKSWTDALEDGSLNILNPNAFRLH